MIYGGFFRVTEIVVDYAQIYVGKEFTGNVGDVFVFLVVFDGFFVVFGIFLSKFLIVYSNAIISQCLSMYIPNRLANS